MGKSRTPWLNERPFKPCKAMTRKDLESKLRELHEKHRAAHQETVQAINAYLDEHPEGLSVTQQADPSGDWRIEQMVHDMLHNAAWIEDRLAGRTGSVGNPQYRHSLTKKVRRIMGYLVP